MGAVILCEFLADESVKTLILDSVALLAVEGSGELLFTGRQSDVYPDRELIAARLSSLEGAYAVIRAWRLQRLIPPAVDVRLIKIEPIRPFDNPLMLFP